MENDEHDDAAGGRAGVANGKTMRTKAPSGCAPPIRAASSSEGMLSK